MNRKVSASERTSSWRFVGSGCCKWKLVTESYEFYHHRQEQILTLHFAFVKDSTHIVPLVIWSGHIRADDGEKCRNKCHQNNGKISTS